MTLQKKRRLKTRELPEVLVKLWRLIEPHAAHTKQIFAASGDRRKCVTCPSVWYRNASLLISSICSPFAYARVHVDFDRHLRLVSALELNQPIALTTSDDVLAAAAVLKLWLRSIPDNDKVRRQKRVTVIGL